MHVFAGDALDCCQALALLQQQQLQQQSKTLKETVVIRQRGSQPLLFLESVPVQFDHIDTSNIVDSIGLMNVLCACHNLLAPDLHAQFDIHRTAVNSIKECRE